MPLLDQFYERTWERLAELCFEMMLAFNRLLEIDSRIVKASDLAGVTGAKSELILNLCRRLGGTTYIAGTLGRNYLDEAAFERAGIRIAYQDYHHPVYRQAYPGFEANMAVVDLLMNAERPAAVFRGDD